VDCTQPKKTIKEKIKLCPYYLSYSYADKFASNNFSTKMNPNLFSDVAVCANQRVSENEFHGRLQVWIKLNQINGSKNMFFANELLSSLKL